MQQDSLRVSKQIHDTEKTSCEFKVPDHQRGQLLKNPQRHGKRYTIQPLDC